MTEPSTRRPRRNNIPGTSIFRARTKRASEHCRTSNVFRLVPMREKLNKENRNKCSDRNVPKHRQRAPRGAERNIPYPLG